MLNIIFGDINEKDYPNYVYEPGLYFNNTYLDSWITDDFSKRMIKSVDKGIVISRNAVDSKAMGIIPVTMISRGLKTLILLQHDSTRIFNVSACGDNCARWVLEIAKRSDKDLLINLRHIMDFGDKPYEIKIVNNDMVVHNAKEYVMNAGLFL